MAHRVVADEALGNHVLDDGPRLLHLKNKISRFSPALFRDAITRSSRLIISCRGRLSLINMLLQMQQVQCSCNLTGLKSIH